MRFILFNLLLIGILVITSCKKEQQHFSEPSNENLNFSEHPDAYFVSPLYSDTSIRSSVISGIGTNDGMMVLSKYITKDELLNNGSYNSNYRIDYVSRHDVKKFEKKRTMRSSGWNYLLKFNNNTFGYIYYTFAGNVVFKYLSHEGFVTNEWELDHDLTTIFRTNLYALQDIISYSDDLLILLSVRKGNEYPFYIIRINSSGQAIDSLNLGFIEDENYKKIGITNNDNVVVTIGDFVYLLDEGLNLLNTDTIYGKASIENRLSSNAVCDHFFIGNKRYNQYGDFEYEINAEINFYKRSLFTFDGGLLTYGKNDEDLAEIIKYSPSGVKEWHFSRGVLSMNDCTFMCQLPNGGYMGIMATLDSRNNMKLFVFKMTEDGRLE